MKFVTLDTLFDFSATSVFLNVVRVDGSIHYPAGYGYDPEILKLSPVGFVSADTSANRIIRTSAIGECGGFEDFQFGGPGCATELFPRGYAYSFIWPIPGVGSVMTFCSHSNELTIEKEEFLLIVGGILSIELTQVRRPDFLDRTTRWSGPASKVALTPRQWDVIAGIRKGLTNSEIAINIGYSESLIRQEMLQIYRKMGVSGRKEVIESNFDIPPENMVS